jgi:chromosome segregation ATPase
MKKSLISLLSILLFMTTMSLLTSCAIPEKKVENAQTWVVDEVQEKVADAKSSLTEAQKKANTEAENAAAWEAYKAEWEVKVHDNDQRITELKAEMKKARKSIQVLYKENIVLLEKRNAALKARIVEYDKNRSNWESFKTEFDHDMDELATALKDFTVNNK